MSNDINLDSQALLSFLYQMPYGVVSADEHGQVQLMNAYATSVLIPLADSADLSDLFSVLKEVDPDLLSKTKAFTKSSGTIFRDERHHFKLANQDEIWLDLTLIKLSEQQVMLGIIDRTELVLIERKAREEQAKQADSAARLEMATSVIHDIGNAISAVGVNSASLVATNNWPEIANIDRACGLLKANEAGLDQVLGANKGSALTNFLSSISSAITQRQESFKKTALAIAKNLHHVQDIIRIQKQFARDGAGAPLKPVDLVEVIYHAESIITNTLASQNIKLCFAKPVSPPLVTGDKTRLTQVMVNLLKNACEAIIDMQKLAPQAYQGEISIEFELATTDVVTLIIKDNGIGFDETTAAALQAGQFTSKQEGSGIGLQAIKAVIESHQGEFSISSDGKQLGCKVSLSLPAYH